MRSEEIRSENLKRLCDNFMSGKLWRLPRLTSPTWTITWTLIMILLMSPSRLLPQRMSPSRLLSQHPSQDITPGVDEKILPDSASLCCDCSAGAALRCPQCNLDYCKACSDGAHRFVALTGHSPAPLEEPTVVFSVGPSRRSKKCYLPVSPPSTSRLINSWHSSRGPCTLWPWSALPWLHPAPPSVLLYDLLYSEVGAEGFKSLNEPGGAHGSMVHTCRSREDVICLLQFILDTLLERKRGLSARVRKTCVELRNGPPSNNQLFVHSLYALVKDEVATQSKCNLQRDYLIEDVAEIPLMSRHLFYPHKAIKFNRTSSSGWPEWVNSP